MICKNCPCQETCNSPCSINILPIGKGNGEDECPEYDNCKRIKNYNTVIDKTACISCQKSA